MKTSIVFVQDPLEEARDLVHAWALGALREDELLKLRSLLPAIINDAKAWRDGVTVLRGLQQRVIPCGHRIENLIGGQGSVTKCGECLRLHQEAKKANAHRR